jgi:hypothetical protein
MFIDASFQNLVSGTIAAHIHVINGPLDANLADTLGPVATTTPYFPNFPLGVTAGTYQAGFDTSLAGAFNPAFVTAAGSVPAAEAALFLAILEGRAYFNIHSTVFTGGEIRGFLQPTTVPEPGTVALLAGGLALLAARQLRRRYP